MPGARKTAAKPERKAPKKHASGAEQRRRRRAKATDERSTMTAKQQLFIEAFLGAARGNATEAARLAGYAGKTRAQWQNQADEVMSNQKIREAIGARLAEAKACLKADEVLEELSEQARASIDDFLTGNELDLEKARALGKMHLIKKIAWTKDGIRIELRDQHAALVDLGRYHKLFVERRENTGPDGGPIKHQHGLDDDAAQVLARLLGVHPAQLPAREADRAES